MLSQNQPHHTCSKHSSENTRTRIEKKTENILSEDQFGFGRGKELRVQLIQFKIEVRHSSFCNIIVNKMK